MKKEDVLTRDCHDKPAVLSDYAWDRLAISSKCFVFDLSVPNTISEHNSIVHKCTFTKAENI